MEPSRNRFEGAPRERVVNVPLLPLLIALSMPLLYLFQTRLPYQGSQYAFVPADLAQGEWGGLFTSMLLHGSWGHAGMNAAAALIFGAPVARLLKGAGGAIAFIALYIASGVVAALGYALVHADSTDQMIGASGAVFGLIGAAMRLLGGRGRVLPLTDGRVVRTAVAWMVVNAATGLIGFAPGAEGARIAWEAHAFGFVFGVLAIGPLGRIFGRAPSSFDSPDGLGDLPP